MRELASNARAAALAPSYRHRPSTLRRHRIPGGSPADVYAVPHAAGVATEGHARCLWLWVGQRVI